jgi:hypothetical protein
MVSKLTWNQENLSAFGDKLAENGSVHDGVSYCDGYGGVQTKCFIADTIEKGK